ncbi:MAG TPA: hypothetical protein VGS41_14960 [Chthonomonadales bacterium]|nr:hypothetical protein [Chthonomonadales bacterium]
MKEFEIAAPAAAGVCALEALLPGVCAAEGLRITLDDSLAAYPGSRHWHLKLARLPGTLELTCWPASNRIWLSIRAGRTAAWAEEAAPRLCSVLEEALKSVSADHSIP